MNAKLPHSLRMIILLLRLTLGLNFFYLGFASLFNQPLEQELGKRSLGSLYAWIATPGASTPFQAFLPWAFLVIGICLALGLITRFMSLAAIALMLINYLPGVLSSGVSASQFINDEVIVVLCLLVIIFSNACAYLGIDKFIHVHLASKHNKK